MLKQHLFSNSGKHTCAPGGKPGLGPGVGLGLGLIPAVFVRFHVSPFFFEAHKVGNGRVPAARAFLSESLGKNGSMFRSLDPKKYFVISESYP